MNKKLIGMVFCMLLIAATILPVAGNITNIKLSVNQKENQEKDILFGITPISINTVPTPKKTETKESPLEIDHIIHPLDIPVASSDNPEYHPTLALDETGWLFGAYTIETDISESNIYYTFSSDSGMTFETLGYYTFEGMLDFPTIDYWGSGHTFIGTFMPDSSDCDGSAQYLFRVEDPTDLDTWALLYWDWSSYNQRDKENPDVACYNDVGSSTWWYGVMADTGGSDYPDETGDHIPLFYFADYNDENSGWIWWWNSFENSAHASVSIDRSNGNMYAAWDHYNESTPEKGRDILLAIADVHDWWAENWVINWYLLGGNENTTYPDITAADDNIYIACQSDLTRSGQQDILCYYSQDGGDTWDLSMIASDPLIDELYPSIVAQGEDASCVFTKDGDLYVSYTDDGGETWASELIKVNDVDGTVEEIESTVEMSFGGIVWTDNQNGNLDVYWNKFLSLSPDNPVIDGPPQLKINTDAEFTAVTTDPQNDDVEYGWDWDADDIVDEWTDAYPSGDVCTITHSWDTQGDYEIQVKARDETGHESGWSNTLPITVPYNKNSNNIPGKIEYLEKFFPDLFELLEKIFTSL